MTAFTKLMRYVSPLAALCLLLSLNHAAAEDYQYKFEQITISRPSAEEPKREAVSVDLAKTYLEQGTLAWSGERKCVSCHANGTYMVTRPALSASLGQPPEDT